MPVTEKKTFILKEECLKKTVEILSGSQFTEKIIHGFSIPEEICDGIHGEISTEILAVSMNKNPEGNPGRFIEEMLKEFRKSNFWECPCF